MREYPAATVERQGQEWSDLRGDERWVDAMIEEKKKVRSVRKARNYERLKEGFDKSACRK